MPSFVLIHSPVVGPATWSPVAARLRESGCEVVVPSLLGVGEGAPPFWPRVVAAVRAAVAGTGSSRPVVLVAHSNAGAFVPVIADGLAQPVACSIFADAVLPEVSGSTPTAGADFLPFLRDLAGPDGRLPRWSDWWDEQDLAPMFPSPQARAVITAEQPRLPLDYYREQVPVPAGWDAHPRSYLQFSPGYQGEARQARERGWTVRELAGTHLHQVADPGGVAAVLLSLAGAA